MNPTGNVEGYLILAYVISLTLLWGYTILTWISVGRLSRRLRRQDAA
jgi:hypothetical protein